MGSTQQPVYAMLAFPVKEKFNKPEQFQ